MNRSMRLKRSEGTFGKRDSIYKTAWDYKNSCEFSVRPNFVRPNSLANTLPVGLGDGEGVWVEMSLERV